MMINGNYKRQTLVSTLLITTLSALSGYSDGYRNPPPTAEGIGKAGVHSAFVNDASAISYNPANLSMQTNQSVVLSATFAKSENTYTPTGSLTTLENDADWQVLPNVYYATPINEKISAGIGFTTPYGQAVRWNSLDFQPAATPTNMAPYKADVQLLNINPTVAFNINDVVHIGVGVSAIYSTFELSAVQGAVITPGPGQVYSEIHGEGDGWGFGANVGVTWLPTDEQRVALTYRSQYEIEYTGSFTAPAGSPFSDQFETSITYPNSVGLGYGYQIGDDVQIEALVEWLQWSVNDTQTINAGGNVTEVQNNWDDTFTLGFGGSWQVANPVILRGGYAYIPTPIPDESMTPLLMDADRHVLSVGAGFVLGNAMVDVAYTYSFYDDRDTPSGSYELDSDLFGLTYSLSF